MRATVLRDGCLLLSLLFLLLQLIIPVHSITACVECTERGKVWCPQYRSCVDKSTDCPTLDTSAISWFMKSGTCSFNPVILPSLCPTLEVEFDGRMPPLSLLTGNQIMVPIQPRILVDDSYANQTYDMGGFFSKVPKESEQTPQFFFFSNALDRFVATLHYQPYSAVVERDEYSVNASQVLQLLDMTVVGNSNLEYEMIFVVSRRDNENHGCAFTPPLRFKQTPTYYDFRFTLGAVGLVVWLLGTFALLNFMIYFNNREKYEKKKKGSPLLGVSDTSELPNSPSTETILVATKRKKTFGEKFKKYRGKLLDEGRKFIRSCSMSDKEFLTDYGVTLYHYIWFHRMALIYIGICSLVACLLGLPTDLIGGANRDLIAGDFATSTIASVTMDSYANLVHFFIVIINISLSIGFVWRLRKLSFAVIVAEEQQALPAQEFAIEIKGLPKEVLDEQMLREHFALIYGEDQIISAHISLSYGKRWKLETIKQKKEEYEREYEENNIRPQIFRRFWHLYDETKKVDAINYYDEKMNDLRPILQFTDPSLGSGYAYVTFADRDTVRQCLKNNNHSTRWYWYRKLLGLLTSQEVSSKANPHFTTKHSEALECRKWHVRPAPLPNEIIWPNLENSALKRKLMQLFGISLEVIVLACVLSVTLGFALIEVARDLYLTDIYYQFGGATILEAIASVSVVILPEAVAIIEEVVAPVVETVEEHAGHIHKSGWRKTVMWHTAFFELMSGLVISRMIYFLIGVAVLYDAQSPFNSYHYLFNKTGMDMMKYMCIKTFTVYGIKYPALCLIKLVQSRLSGKLERPDFDYFDLYAQKIIVMFCVLLYGSVMPLILPLGLMYLSISFLYDRWAIVNFHKKDVSHDSKLLFYAADVSFSSLFFPRSFTFTLLQAYFNQSKICSFYFAIAPLGTLIVITKLFKYWPICAATLIIFSIVVGIVMLETRRWQYLNQNIKGIRRIIKASDHTFAKHMAAAPQRNSAVIASVPNKEGITEESEEGEEGGEGEEGKVRSISDTTKMKWTLLANATKMKTQDVKMKTKDVILGVVKGMKEGVMSTKLERGLRTEEEVLRTAYIHPLAKK